MLQASASALLDTVVQLKLHVAEHEVCNQQ